MLLNVESLIQAKDSERTLYEVVSALCCSTRETDIAGWYREGAILGVLFTEINAEGSAPESLIRAKVTDALCARLDAEQVGRIRCSLHRFPEDWDLTSPGPPIDAKLYPDLFGRDEARKFTMFVKRLVDVIGSILAIILCLPLWVAIALAIKLTSKGPVLFRQERVGRYGARFVFLKFRSMKCVNDPSIHREYVRRLIVGAADSGQPSASQKSVYKIRDDPRVTRVGKFIRRTSLDELPQFINVLKGEMSLVGPRPAIPYELEVYQAWHRLRMLEAKPGITGLWQVSGRSRTTFDNMVRLDLQYARNWSLWWDMKILLQTPFAVLFCEGAY